ncbi:E3 ubiquitin-protein ligase SGR9, amyloplastic [Heracleum sosnowskyi]|uniref:RING-type E3 ubiquitin transferase n=1 Tax=Heracleum sosnowskyi TaxID=360622 RepID=A0AAD8NBW9_9APIA|nr:E3 ubiquitin-protein ligase SGR9, amyloplastic [Heracleum sosnowskyi]
MDNHYSVFMDALSTLTPSQLSDLIASISALFQRHNRRLATLLSSPALFSLTLRHLESLSLHHKFLLIGKHLLSNLTHLSHFMLTKTSGPSFPASHIKLRDLDAVLLLLLFCELRQHDPSALEVKPSEWRIVLCNYYVYNTMLTFSSLVVSDIEVLNKFVESLSKFLRFVGVIDCDGSGKEAKEVAAAAAVVVALPSVEVSGGGKECVICKEEMKQGRDVCKLPCTHLFHWMCILPWLRKTNTCPCCRFRLPSDDISGEIERMWEVLIKIGSGSNSFF